jgi:hypothetical protein
MKRFVEQGLNALSPEDAARSRLQALDDWADFLLQVWQKALIEWQERQVSQSGVRQRRKPDELINKTGKGIQSYGQK